MVAPKIIAKSLKAQNRENEVNKNNFKKVRA